MKIKESFFQLKQQRLLKVEYEINDNFDFNKIKLNMDYSLDISKSEEKKEVQINMNLKIFNKEEIDTLPFYFDLIIQGLFTWNSEDIDESLFKVNAPAILMSYLRPVVSQLTSFSGYPPLILPLINFVEN